MSDFTESISREGALHGITWRSHKTNQSYPGAATHPVLHIGTLENFQIHLSRNEDDDNYRMQLWEMTVVPQFDEATNQTAATPQYSILISNAVIKAADLDNAKYQAIGEVLRYISNDYAAAMTRYENMLSLFSDLDATLSKKTARRRAAEPIEHLGLSGRALLNLQRANIRVIGELVSKTVTEIRNLDGIGDDSLNNIRICLHKANLRLQDETTESISLHDLQIAMAAANHANESAANETPGEADQPENQGEAAPAETAEKTDLAN